MFVYEAKKFCYNKLVHIFRPRALWTSNSKVDHTQVHWGQWVYGLSHYVLGCGNRESIAQMWS